jgi:ProP effector
VERSVLTLWPSLKIGIHRDLAERAPDLVKSILRVALARYVGNQAYLFGLSEGGPRIDLDSNEAGIVTAEQAAKAKETGEATKDKAAGGAAFS